MQNIARFLVGQEGDVVFYGSAGNVNVPELTGHDRGIVALDAQSPGLQATRQVRQGSGIDKLPEKRGCRLGNAANQVDQAKTIEPQTGHVLIMHEMQALRAQRIVLVPVAPDRQDGTAALNQGHHIRQGDTGLVAVIIGILVTFKVEIDVHLQQNIAVIMLVGGIFPLKLVVFLLNIGIIRRIWRQFDVAIQASDL